MNTAIRKIPAIGLAALVSAVMTFPPPTKAAEDRPPAAIANAGTLTCTLAPSNDDPIIATDAELSCRFDSISGQDAEFTGVVKRLGADEERDAKIVMVWSVLAPKTGIDSKQLEGRYLGSLGGRQGPELPDNTGLIGGADNSIELKPLTDEPDVTDSWGISVLELKIAAVRA